MVVPGNLDVDCVYRFFRINKYERLLLANYQAVYIIFGTPYQAMSFTAHQNVPILQVQPAARNRQN